MCSFCTAAENDRRLPDRSCIIRIHSPSSSFPRLLIHLLVLRFDLKVVVLVPCTGREFQRPVHFARQLGIFFAQGGGFLSPNAWESFLTRSLAPHVLAPALPIAASRGGGAEGIVACLGRILA